MSTTTKTPPDTSTDPAPDSDLSVALAEIAALKKELADAAKKAAVPAPDAEPEPAEPTHMQLLACGHSVVTAVPVASHHFCEDHEITVPVTSCFELGKED